jgi:aspartyl-tRNA(Asn)/glutamyl-tRNA(Gln) amidotransferase subunit A
MDVAQTICGMDATALAEAIRTKQLSPVEVVDAHLERMEKLEPSIHAFCTVTAEAARKEARNVEARILRGEKVGALAGVPVGIKDLVSTAGIRTTSGSVAYQDFIPDEDDVVVERLKKADAIIVGKTNVPEFGYSGVGHNPIFETTRNPWNLDMTPGGSSAGSGAAVASGEIPFAIGSDGGGSIRFPAAHCGI